MAQKRNANFVPAPESKEDSSCPVPSCRTQHTVRPLSYLFSVLLLPSDCRLSESQVMFFLRPQQSALNQGPRC